LPPSSQSHHSPKGVTYGNQVDSILDHGFHSLNVDIDPQLCNIILRLPLFVSMLCISMW